MRSAYLWITAGIAVAIAACATGTGLDDGVTTTGGTGAGDELATTFPVPASSGGGSSTSGGKSSSSTSSSSSSSSSSSGTTSSSSSSGSTSSSSSSSSGSTSSSSSGSSGSSGGGCVPPVAGGACDTFPQCGCAAGQKCDVSGASGITTCVADGPLAAYRGCTGIADCAKGTSCIDGACKPFCNTSADCGGQQCLQVSYEGFPVTGWTVCAAGCDPVTPGAKCGPGVTCWPTNTVGGGIADCVGGAGTGTGPGACAAGPWSCAPGYTCVAGTTDCRKWCKLGGSDCAAGETCTMLPTGIVLVNGGTYGACL